MKKVLTAILAAAAMLCSCTKPVQPAADDKISFDLSSVKISADAGQATINLEASGDWSIKSIPDWLGYVRPDAGKAGKHTLTISGRFYEGDSPRSGKVTAVCGNASAGFEVVQSARSVLELNPSSVEDYSAAGGSLSIDVKCDQAYTVDAGAASAWIGVNSSSQTKAVLTIAANNGEKRSAKLTFTSKDGSASATLSLSQSGNAAYTDMLALKALYNSTGGDAWTKKDNWNSDKGLGSWHGVKTDAAGRVISLDLSNNNLQGRLPDELSQLTELKELYLYGNRLSGSLPKGMRLLEGWDGFAASKHIYPQQNGFGLSTVDAEVVQYRKSPKAKAMDIVILGDAYDKNGLMLGGGFDALVEKSIKALFSIEPMTSLKDYFNIYTVSAESQDAYISTNAGNTAFGTYFLSADFSVVTMNTNWEKVFQYVGKAPVSDIRNAVVILLVNTQRFGGTTLSWNDGKHLSIIPDYRGGQSTTESVYGFEGLLHHEAIGHALGLLDEEYHSNSSTAPVDFANTLAVNQSKGQSLNISATSDPAKVPWAGMIGKKGCEDIGVFEGAGNYSYGAWRSSKECCMVDNRPDFSQWCRYLIWSRVRNISGENAELDEYLKTL